MELHTYAIYTIKLSYNLAISIAEQKNVCQKVL